MNLARRTISDIVSWWKRRQALRQAPRFADIERIKQELAAEARRHGRTAPVRRRLTAAMTSRLAAEQGVRLNTRSAS